MNTHNPPLRTRRHSLLLLLPRALTVQPALVPQFGLRVSTNRADAALKVVEASIGLQAAVVAAVTAAMAATPNSTARTRGVEI